MVSWAPKIQQATGWGGILYPDGIASDGSMDRLAKVTFEIVVRVVSFE